MIAEGDLAEDQNRHEDATNLYYSALLKKPGIEHAMQALQRSAQPVLNEKFAQFSKYVVDNKIEEAVKQYKNAERYAANAAEVGVKLNWPTEYDEVYADVRDEYVLSQYDGALRLLQEKKFDAAEKQFQQIAVFDSTYRDATILRLNTVLDPLYQRGLRQMAKGQYKDAYNSFSRILEIDDHFKDAAARQKQAKESATVSLAILPVTREGVRGEREAMLGQAVTASLSKHNSDPYLSITGNEELFRNLESRGWPSITDARKAAEAARNFGYRYALLINILQVEEKETPFTSVPRDAYEAFTENILNPITGTYSSISKFRKVKYDDTFQARSLSLKIQYRLVLSETGAVLLGDEIEETRTDEQHRLGFNGNLSNLYRELPQGSFLPPPDEAWRNQFTGNNQKKLRSFTELSSELSAFIAEKIAPGILAKIAK
jgi:tetratricopeptide (TPR) repeat protein